MKERSRQKRAHNPNRVSNRWRQPSSRFETFRDPAGSLRIAGDRVLREVHPEHAKAALRFLQSKTAQEWVAQGRLIETRFIPHENGDLTLEHPRVFFPSYPWEWTPSAWIAAADLTLDLCEGLLDQGLILKDATPLNVLFRGTRPVLVDVLSVEERDPASPLWLGVWAVRADVPAAAGGVSVSGMAAGGVDAEARRVRTGRSGSAPEPVAAVAGAVPLAGGRCR